MLEIGDSFEYSSAVSIKNAIKEQGQGHGEVIFPFDPFITS